MIDYFYQKVTKYVKQNIALSILYFLVFVCISWMTVTNTLSYPYIMADRQVQMIWYCLFSSNTFTTREYGFEMSAPKGNCFLPNRIFPSDTGVQVLPNGFYFVLNEYIKGSVVENSRSTIAFEPRTDQRNTQFVISSLRRGGFLNESKIREFTNKNGVKITVLTDVRGIDPTTHYDWAFIDHPNKKIFFSIMLMKISEPEVFNYILENIKAI